MNAPTIEQLPIKNVKPAADNYRGDLDNLDELATSIKSVGLLEPIIVTRRNGGYDVVAGHRRLAASKLAGLSSIDAIVREFATDGDRLLAMAIENLQRDDLSVLEEARAYKQLVEQLGCSQRELAAKVGKTQSHISKRLTLLELPEKAQTLVDSGGITVAAALELGKLSEHPERIGEVLKDIEADGRAEPEEVAWEIENQLAEVARLEKVANARKLLETAGVRIVESNGHGPPNGAVRISKGGSYQELKLDPEKHAVEPCHAAFVNHYGDVVHVCTDRKRHPKLKTESERFQSSGDADRDRGRKEQRELREVTKARHEFLKTFVTSKTLGGNDLTPQVLEAFIIAGHQAAAKLACQFLGLEPESKKARGAYYASIDYNGALRAHAAKGQKETLQVLAALVAGTHEESLASPWSDVWSKKKAYIEWLEKRGHTLMPFESRKIGRKRAAAQKAA
jgi:ParB/RepB/Spo0J family partition protein